MSGDPRSWNPWHGCRKYSEGCDHCYMYALDAVHKMPERSSQVVRTASFGLPLKRTRGGSFKIPAGYQLRVNMTSDTFLEEADPWRTEMWDLIRAWPDVVFYLLTKRAPRIEECLPPDWGKGWDNVSLNITCESQRTFDERWPPFERIPARHKGFNLAPLLGPIDLTPALATDQIESVGCGGESFGSTRPCDYAWVRRISDDCRRHGVNFTFDSTGSVFVKDGRRYWLRKAIQAEQAYKSGLSHHDRPVSYVLRDPADGHVLGKDELLTRTYNLDKCLVCPMLHECSGCAICHQCKEPRIATYDDVLRARRLSGGHV